MEAVNIRRYEKNPIITIEDVKPSNDQMKVLGIFNCAVAKYKDEVILLCRVAETVNNSDTKLVMAPVVALENGIDKLKIITFDKTKDTEYDYSDSRSVLKILPNGAKQVVYLTSLSHLRLARSKDGINFKVEDKPAIFPRACDEEWGIEDPRITQIEDTYYINYTSVTRNGAATSLISTKDFINYKRHGIIFAPENKDVTIFPEKISGKYVAFNRPVPKIIGSPDIWIAESPDLVHWGNQKHFYGVNENGSWEAGRIGGGAVPFKTEKGWIEIYHATDKNNRYCLGVFLLDENNPSKLIGKSQSPILEPNENYEKIGFFNNVVFTCGCLYENNVVKIYYAATDDKVCLAEVHISEIYRALGLEEE